jgi:hypothetical protein
MRKRVLEKPVGYTTGKVSFGFYIAKGHYTQAEKSLRTVKEFQPYSLLKSYFLRGYYGRINEVSNSVLISFEKRSKIVSDLESLQKEELSKDPIDFLGVIKKMSEIEKS